MGSIILSSIKRTFSLRIYLKSEYNFIQENPLTDKLKFVHEYFMWVLFYNYTVDGF